MSRASMSLRILVSTALLSAATYMTAQVARDVEMVPTGKGYGVAVDKSNNNNGQVKGNAQPGGQAGGNQCPNGICWHGGPVMGTGSTTAVNIYYIWYGGWAGNSATTLLPGLISDLSGSGYEHINTTYSLNSTTAGTISGKLNLAASATVGYSHGTSLNDNAIQQIVTDYLGNAKPDPAGIYFVLTSADVNETSGFCTQYCGWHTHATINTGDAKYAFVGNPDRCPSSCAEETSISPNGNVGADGMASIIAHESEEAISDPDLNSWYDRRGEENADKCAWTFGSTTPASNGSYYNFTGTTSGTHWLIQRNWLNANGGSCVMSF